MLELRSLSVVALLGCCATLAPSTRASSPAQPGRAASVGVLHCRGVAVGVRSDLPRIVDTRPAGTTFCLAAGVHRLTAPVVPKDRDRFLGLRGAVLDGSQPLDGFTRSGSYWAAPRPSVQPTQPYGQCAGGGSACQLTNDVFFDDRPLRRVLSLDQVGPGTFFDDTSAPRTYIGRDPAGHQVALGAGSTAFKGWGSGADDVLVQGLVVQHFANQAGTGAINGRPSWRVVSNVVRWNHAVGVQDASVIRDNEIYDNGQLGIMGSFDVGSLVEDNLISGNNYAGFDPSWEAGGAKWVKSSGLTIRGNTVSGNRGPGLWCDTDCAGITYDHNTISGNTGPGIFHEVSYEATIAGNVISRNGFGAGGWLDGAGILLSNSAGVEVVGNTVSLNRDGIGVTQTDRGVGPRGAYRAQDLLIKGNTVTMRGGHTGVVQNVGDPSLYTSANIRFSNNRYRLGCSPSYFAWQAPGSPGHYAYISWSAWRETGNDVGGRATSICK